MEPNLWKGLAVRLSCASLQCCDNFCVGGGSALLPSPIPPVTLEDIAFVTKLLQSNGATIQQLNVVRKNLELLKGGGLAKLAHPAQVNHCKLSNEITPL